MRVVTALTEDQRAALEVAWDLASAGVSLFLAYPSDGHPTGFAPAAGWQRSRPDHAVVQAWRPGLALCLLTGCGLDLVDVDPRSGGDAGGHGAGEAVAWADTPSGGRHYFVPAIGERSRDGVYPGVDVKAGAPDGSGRGFAFVAPTVRRSKVDGTERAYRWGSCVAADVARVIAERGTFYHAWSAELGGRIRELRAARAPSDRARRVPASVAAREWAAALARLRDDVRTWAIAGWGGEAHAGLLAATTHLARLNPEGAEEGLLWAFEAAGAEPDDDDLGKLHSALDATVPDVVVPDAELGWQELWWSGAEVPQDRLPGPPPFATTAPAAVSTPVEEGGNSPNGRFRFLDEHEVEAIPEPDRLVDGLLWTSTVARLFGASGSGKTWVAVDLAAHVACGMPWQGREVKQVPTLLVAAEGAPGLGLRLRVWRDRHRRGTQVRVWPAPVTVGGPDWGEFVDACATEAFGLVVLDTQAACTVGYNENSNSDAAMVLRALAGLVAATGACALLVHHVGHEEIDRARGATAMFGGLDTELRLVEARRGDGLALHQDKQKYAERGSPTRLRLERHGEGLVVAAAGPDDEASRASRLAAMEAHVAALEGSGGAVHARHSQNHLVAYLVGLGRTGDRRVMHDAARVFKARAGVAGVVLPDYARDPATLLGVSS